MPSFQEYGADEDHDEGGLPASAKKPKKVAITVADFARATGKDEEQVLMDCQDGKPPAGYK